MLINEIRGANARNFTSKADRNKQMMILLSKSYLQRSLQNPSLINGINNRRHIGIGVLLLRTVRHFAKLRYLVLGGVGSSAVAAKMV